MGTAKYASLRFTFTIQSFTANKLLSRWASSILKCCFVTDLFNCLRFIINLCSLFFLGIVKTGDRKVVELELYTGDMVFLSNRDWSSWFTVSLFSFDLCISLKQG